MNDATRSFWPSGLVHHPLTQLILARVRDFFREPEALFWVYGFPLLIALALGTAFRERPVEKLDIDFVGDLTSVLVDSLIQTPELRLHMGIAETDGERRLRTGKSCLLVIQNAAGPPTLRSDPNRAESALALALVENVLLRSVVHAEKQPLVQRQEIQGTRYIDFLIPGLIGMNLMGGGLWGVGYVTVDMRARKLLKRLVATPMSRVHFLLSLCLSRLLFNAIEIALLVVFSWLVFGVAIHGSVVVLIAVILVGGATFQSIGLLVASRANTYEAVNGLMNLVMLPMYVLSGVFFSSERFPDAMQVVIGALPLSALNKAIRIIMTDGGGFIEVVPSLGIMLVWMVVSFFLATRIFRWR